jgi:hypothetical protein
VRQAKLGGSDFCFSKFQVEHLKQKTARYAGEIESLSKEPQLSVKMMVFKSSNKQTKG